MERDKMDKLQQIENEIRNNYVIHEQDKITLLHNLQKIRNQKVNILITGATGCGKSSTINALFGDVVATVGVGVEPETISVAEYHLGALTIWDSPGFGDGIEADKCHAKKIASLLQREDESGYPLIDMVLLILDGSQKDYGTSFELLNSVLLPNLGENRKNRVLIAINQADQAKKGRGWDKQKNQPTPALITFLDKKVDSTQQRIKTSTGVDICPIYYSAGYCDETETQKPYNLSKLLYFIITHSPDEKMPLILEKTNQNDIWGERPEDNVYQKRVIQKVTGVIAGAKWGAQLGTKLGAYLGPAGTTMGGFLGAVCGALLGFFS